MCLNTYSFLFVAYFTYVHYSLTAPIDPYYLQNSYPEYLPRNGSHDVTFGRKTPDDRMLYHVRYVKRNSSDRDAIAKHIIKYPSTGMLRDKNITCVEIFDMMSNNIGGYAKLINGGPGDVNVTIRLESQPGYGFDFLVKIFAFDTNEIE